MTKFAEGVRIAPSARVFSPKTIHEGASIGDDALICVRVDVQRNAIVQEGARISPGCSIGEGTDVGVGVTLTPNVRIGSFSQIGDYTRIEGPAFTEPGVVIGPKMRIEYGALILRGAEICRNDVASKSRNARELEWGVSVGAGVKLHDEVELGRGAIIPTQRTIASIGSFGTKNRVVTIYGSDNGPRYSVGCQIGVNYETIVERVGTKSNSTVPSAATYVPFLGVFNEIGSVVQNAYDTEAQLVDEIKSMRTQKGLPIVEHT